MEPNEKIEDNDQLARLKDEFGENWQEQLRANDVFVDSKLKELKKLGPHEFLEQELDEDSVRHFWNKGWYPEAVWLLKVIDSLITKLYPDCSTAAESEYRDIRDHVVFSVVPGPTPEDLDVQEPWLRVCRVRCKLCGDVLERTYKSPNDYGGGMMTCQCGKVALDPGPVLWCINGNPENYEILHELAEG